MNIGRISGYHAPGPEPPAQFPRKSILSSGGGPTSLPQPGDRRPPWERGRRVSRQLASLSIADMSPRLAVQRVLQLFQRGEHR